MARVGDTGAGSREQGVGLHFLAVGYTGVVKTSGEILMRRSAHRFLKQTSKMMGTHLYCCCHFSQTQLKKFLIIHFKPRSIVTKMLYSINITASVAKWLRQWVVIPPFAGSSPVVRPFQQEKIKVNINIITEIIGSKAPFL